MPAFAEVVILPAIVLGASGAFCASALDSLACAERVIEEHPVPLVDVVLGGLPGVEQRRLSTAVATPRQ